MESNSKRSQKANKSKRSMKHNNSHLHDSAMKKNKWSQFENFKQQTMHKRKSDNSGKPPTVKSTEGRSTTKWANRNGIRPHQHISNKTMSWKQTAPVCPTFSDTNSPRSPFTKLTEMYDFSTLESKNDWENEVIEQQTRRGEALKSKWEKCLMSNGSTLQESNKSISMKMQSSTSESNFTSENEEKVKLSNYPVWDLRALHLMAQESRNNLATQGSSVSKTKEAYKL